MSIDQHSIAPGVSISATHCTLNRVSCIIGNSARICSGAGTALRPPNGLAFRCRERAADHLQKPNDLAREAVSCNAVLGLPPPLIFGLSYSSVVAATMPNSSVSSCSKSLETSLAPLFACAISCKRVPAKSLSFFNCDRFYYYSLLQSLPNAYSLTISV